MTDATAPPTAPSESAEDICPAEFHGDENYRDEFHVCICAELATYTKAIAERDELREVFQWCSEQVWEGLSIDGGSFQDEMERRGLMVEVPATDEFRAEYDTDVMLTWRWNSDAVLAAKEPTP